MESIFVSLDNAKIEDARLRGRQAQIAMRFEAKLVNCTRDGDGKVVAGDPEKPAEMIDIWTFARDAGTPDPNWKLIATETGH
jgi:predicted lipid-binding transport protein (Tim44 family)